MIYYTKKLVCDYVFLRTEQDVKLFSLFWIDSATIFPDISIFLIIEIDRKKKRWNQKKKRGNKGNRYEV
jgi:hypothetical protein